MPHIVQDWYQMMLRISKLADYSTKIMLAMAQTPDQKFAASELAEHTRIPLPTVSKILKILSKGGLLRSQRGSQGGYQLAVEAAQISLACIVRILDGNIAMTNCQEDCCEFVAHCTSKDNWLTISQVIENVLENISLQQMLAPLQGTEFPVRFYKKASI
jgi:FeS assembly SUF system regulator